MIDVLSCWARQCENYLAVNVVGTRKWHVDDSAAVGTYKTCCMANSKRRETINGMFKCSAFTQKRGAIAVYGKLIKPDLIEIIVKVRGIGLHKKVSCLWMFRKYVWSHCHIIHVEKVHIKKLTVTSWRNQMVLSTERTLKCSILVHTVEQ